MTELRHLIFQKKNRKKNGQRTACIKALKWPPTKPTHIFMNNSSVVPIIETDREIGDRYYIWG